MKALRQIALALPLAVIMTAVSFAAVPDKLVVENLNGQQRIVKTYTLSPEEDPETLKEPSFDYGGFTYSWAYTTKEDEPFEDTKTQNQTVTVETKSDTLSVILDKLEPTISYDDGEYCGELALDHTSLKTEASGYTTRYGSVTETKTIDHLDSNDMSYVPATTVKNGRTLSLSTVDWQVTGTELVGESLVPSQYQAVATYSASTSWQEADGYVTTATYTGEVSAKGIDHITYTVVYVGTETVPEVPEEPIEPEFPPDEPEPDPEPGISSHPLPSPPLAPLLVIGMILILLLFTASILLWYRNRKNVFLYTPGDNQNEYRLIAKLHADAKDPFVDIIRLDPYPEGVVAVELGNRLAKALAGKQFTVVCRSGDYQYTVEHTENNWHEFDTETLISIR